MKIRNVMKTDVPTCTPQTTLDAVAHTMWTQKCGIVPVMNADDRVVGVVTDRDIAIAAWTKGRALHEIPAETPMTGRIFSCGPEDDLKVAAESMRKGRCKRLLVLDDDQGLVGVVTLSCLATAARDLDAEDAQQAGQEVVETLASFAGTPKAQVADASS